jgi:hypothetical protein
MSKEAMASCAVFGSYLIGYSSYSKATSTLKPELLLKIFGLTEKSTLHFTLRETNKILALAGMTVLGASFTGYLGEGEVLREHAAVMLLTVRAMAVELTLKITTFLTLYSLCSFSAAWCLLDGLFLRPEPHQTLSGKPGKILYPRSAFSSFDHISILVCKALDRNHYGSDCRHTTSS